MGHFKSPLSQFLDIMQTGGLTYLETWDYANDLTIGWQNLYPLSHPNGTLAPQARQSGEILNYLLGCQSDILVRSLDYTTQHEQKIKKIIFLNCLKAYKEFAFKDCKPKRLYTIFIFHKITFTIPLKIILLSCFQLGFSY